jgi:hypothetical protein
MTKVILQIEDKADLEALLPLLQRLEIPHVVSELEEETMTEEERQYHLQVVEEGVSDVNWDERIPDFEAGREDRKLPFRE